MIRPVIDFNIHKNQHEILRKRIIDNSFPITESGCWIWMSKPEGFGYGQIYINYNGKNTKYRTHRLSYEIFTHQIPVGMHVLHECDEPSCVNPHHLFLGTQGDNNRDMHKKGRFVSGSKKRTHCPKGHEYSQNNTYITKEGHRNCRMCGRISQEKYRWRKNETFGLL